MDISNKPKFRLSDLMGMQLNPMKPEDMALINLGTTSHDDRLDKLVKKERKDVIVTKDIKIEHVNIDEKDRMGHILLSDGRDIGVDLRGATDTELLANAAMAFDDDKFNQFMTLINGNGLSDVLNDTIDKMMDRLLHATADVFNSDEFKAPSSEPDYDHDKQVPISDDVAIASDETKRQTQSAKEKHDEEMEQFLSKHAGRFIEIGNRKNDIMFLLIEAFIIMDDYRNSSICFPTHFKDDYDLILQELVDSTEVWENK